jgi:hypothetical protein
LLISREREWKREIKALVLLVLSVVPKPVVPLFKAASDVAKAGGMVK